MKQKLKVVMIVVCLCLMDAGMVSVQWAMSDPDSLAQGIINSAKEMVETTGAKANTLNGFLETQKTFQQGRRYYDALKSVHDTVKGDMKTSKSISLVMEISETYVDNYRRMLSDENCTPEELTATSPGYTMLIDENSDMLQDLRNVVNVMGISLSDAERLAIIEDAYRSLMNHHSLVRYCTNKTISVNYLRARKKSDMDRVMSLYGTADERYWQIMGGSDNFHQTPLPLYDETMPLYVDMTGAAKGPTRPGVLFYVVMRVWQSLVRAGTIDAYSLLRPLALDLYILFFLTIVLGTMDNMLDPIVQGVYGILETQTFDTNKYHEQKDELEYEALMRNPEAAYLASDKELGRQLDELDWSSSDLVTMTGMYMDRASYSIKKNVRERFRELLKSMFTAATPIIDALRTFFLVMPSTLGLIAFAFAVWDGFYSTLSAWFSRYIQIYLWFPVFDLFNTILAKIQILMLRQDIEHMQADPNFSLDVSDGVYIVLLIIGIVDYSTIPMVAGWITQAGGGIGNYNKNINTTGALGDSVAGVAAGNVTGRASKLTKGTVGKIFRKWYVMPSTNR